LRNRVGAGEHLAEVLDERRVEIEAAEFGDAAGGDHFEA